MIQYMYYYSLSMPDLVLRYDARVNALRASSFAKNKQSQFSSFINQFVFMFANICQELIRTALSTGICEIALTRIDQICIFQEWRFNRIKTEIKEIYVYSLVSLTDSDLLRMESDFKSTVTGRNHVEDEDSLAVTQ